MYLLLIGLVVGLVVLNLYTLQNDLAGEDKLHSMRFLMIRFFLPLIAYCLVIFKIGTKFASVFGMIGVITAMVDVRCQHLRSEEDEKIRHYNKLVVELNSYLIIIYILLL